MMMLFYTYVERQAGLQAVAQLVFAPVVQPEIEETDTIDETDRGAGGFGSTGVRG